MSFGPAPSIDPTPAEQAVLEGIAAGKGAKEISFETGKAVATIHVLMRNLKRRLGARTLPHAVAVAVKRGVI